MAMLLPIEHLSLLLMLACLSASALSIVFSLTYLYYLRSHHGEVKSNAVLLMALTGSAPQLEKLIAQLNVQIIKPVKLLVGVESSDDPAYKRLLEVVHLANFPIEIALAGFATQSSQKCHNLIAAAKLIGDKNEHIVMLDGDIMPPQWWLAALLKPLETDQFDIVSGYRWQQAQTSNIAAALITCLDRYTALLPRPIAASILWGGSLAMRREIFDAILKSKLLETTLSDDLSIASFAAVSHYRVLNRRILLVPTRAPQGFTAAWRFGVRQYKIIKNYRPGLWWFAFGISSLKVIGWIVLFYQSLDSTLYRHALITVVAVALLKAQFDVEISKKLNFNEPAFQRLNQFLLALFKPAADLFSLSMLIASSSARRVTWGHVSYFIETQSRIRILRRESLSQNRLP